MEPGQPSRTSILVAALRAFGARDADPAVRNPDFLAGRLISDADLQSIREHPISHAIREDYLKSRQNPEVAGMSNLVLIRTRFIDEHFRSALQEGATQVVILGAGFDTRPYRFADFLKGKRVFEVDYRSTQEIKKQRLADASIPIPSHVCFAEADFKKDVLRDVLRDAAYDPAARTFFVWEGVSMYLTEDAVRETLRTIALHSGRGSSLVMDFAGLAMIEMLQRFPHLSQHNYSTRWGEPWIFGVPDMRESEFFRECGFELREVVTFFSREAADRYLTRSDGSRLGSVRGGPPQSHRFTTLVGVLSMLLTRRSKWYAVAKLDVSR